MVIWKMTWICWALEKSDKFSDFILICISKSCQKYCSVIFRNTLEMNREEFYIEKHLKIRHFFFAT